MSVIKRCTKITHIQWQWPLNINALKQNDWILNSGSIGNQVNTISLYEVTDEDGEVNIEFWTFETDGKRKAFSDSESLYESLDDPRNCFAGNEDIAKNILCLGWQPWEDEIQLESNQKMIEGLGQDYCGEINLEKISKTLEKFQGKSIYAVFRSVFSGDAKIDFNQLQEAKLYTPDGFEPDDDIEAVRLCYQFKA